MFFPWFTVKVIWQTQNGYHFMKLGKYPVYTGCLAVGFMAHRDPVRIVRMVDGFWNYPNLHGGRLLTWQYYSFWNSNSEVGNGLWRMPCRNKKMVVVVEGGIRADTGDEVFGNWEIMDLWGQQYNTVQNHNILSLGIAYICSRFPNSVLCCLFTMCSHCCYAVKRHSADWYELWAWTDKRSYIAGHICKLFPSVHSLKKAITLERVAQMTWFLA